MHPTLVRFSVLVSPSDECVAQGPAWGGDGDMCVYGGNISLPPCHNLATLDQGDIWWSPGEGKFLCTLPNPSAGGELTWRVLDRGRKVSRRI